MVKEFIKMGSKIGDDSDSVSSIKYENYLKKNVKAFDKITKNK